MSSCANPPEEGTDQLRSFGPQADDSATDELISPGAVILSVGTVIGRYTVSRRIGAGGMGTVYAAHDPELDRQVALKLLNPTDSDPSQVKGGRNWLLREAQAMAKLHHPNVITIHDVGMFMGRVFMAMEFVDGQTLTGWLTQVPRDWPEIVDTFVRAGRGLAAAHAAGLVHRDFKPDNVLVGIDGRVLVTDFGLARQAVATSTLGASVSRSQEPVTPFAGERLTRTGALRGTPAYMAPEQHTGGAIGAAADQFSFCVALYESLYGVRPFAGTNIATLAINVLEGQIKAAPRESPIPTWLYQILRRGLATDPHERFPSMDALLAELQRDPPETSGMWMTAGVAAGIASLLLGGYLWLRPGPEQQCREQLAAMPEFLSAQQADRIRDVFAATGLDYAPVTSETAVQSLANWHSSWTATWTVHCQDDLAMHRRSVQPAGLATQCLESLHDEAERVVSRLASATSSDVTQAVAAVGGLRSPWICAAAVSHGPNRTGEASTAYDDIAQARTFELFGHNRDALQKVAPITTGQVEVDSPALEITALLIQGRSEARLGDPERARSTLRRAVVAASRGGDVAEELEAWSALLSAELRAPPIRDDAWSTLVATEALVTRASLPHVRSRLELFQGHRALALGDATKATEHFRNAVDLDPGASGDLHSAARLRWLGVAQDAAGRFAEASHNLGLAVHTYEESLGSSHPTVAIALIELAAAQIANEQRGAAEASLVRALTQLDAHPSRDAEALGIEQVLTLAAAQDRMGLVLRMRGDVHSAIARHRVAIDLIDRVRRRDAQRLGYPLENLGTSLLEANQPDEAIPYLRRATELWQTTLPPEHSDLLVSYLNLAYGLLQVEGFAEARHHLDYCVQRWSETTGSQQDLLASALTALGRAYLGLGAAQDAAVVLERAYTLREQLPTRLEGLHETAWWLAQALRQTQPEDTRWSSLARFALEGTEGPDIDEATLVERLDQGQTTPPSEILLALPVRVIDRRWASFADGINP